MTSEKHPRAAPLLVQLGLVFARTSRVTIAEGLYRCTDSAASAITFVVLDRAHHSIVQGHVAVLNCLISVHLPCHMRKIRCVAVCARN